MVLFIYTISISILCVSRKKPSFTAFNWVTSEKQDIVELCKVNCYIRKLCIPYNTHSCCEHIAGCDNIYLYGCLSLSAHVCAVPFCMYCLCVCVRMGVWYQITVLIKTTLCRVFPTRGWGVTSWKFACSTQLEQPPSRLRPPNFDLPCPQNINFPFHTK